MSKRAVWKFPLGDWGSGMFSAAMPKDASLLTLRLQNGEPCMWMLVDPDAETEQRHFLILGTGHIYSQEGPGIPFSRSSYAGTFMIEDDALVFHVFEVFGE